MRHAAPCLALLGLLLGSSVSAQSDGLSHYAAALEACFDAAQDPAVAQACQGQASAACMEGEAAGYSTQGMTGCLLAEHAAWDDLLNRDYRRTMEALRQLDADEAEFFPEYAGRADALRTAQRAWIAFRDADCALAHAMWGSGSMRQIAGASCVLDMTAQRTIELRFLTEGMQ